MTQPEALSKNTRLVWSTGKTGTAGGTIMGKPSAAGPAKSRSITLPAEMQQLRQ